MIVMVDLTKKIGSFLKRNKSMIIKGVIATTVVAAGVLGAKYLQLKGTNVLELATDVTEKISDNAEVVEDIITN